MICLPVYIATIVQAWAIAHTSSTAEAVNIGQPWTELNTTSIMTQVTRTTEALTLTSLYGIAAP